MQLAKGQSNPTSYERSCDFTAIYKAFVSMVSMGYKWFADAEC